MVQIAMGRGTVAGFEVILPDVTRGDGFKPKKSLSNNAYHIALISETIIILVIITFNYLLKRSHTVYHKLVNITYIMLIRLHS